MAWKPPHPHLLSTPLHPPQLFQGTSQGGLSGPVKIISMGAEVARDSGSDGLYRFGAALNVNLAVLNVLPLPGPPLGTDAGRGGEECTPHGWVKG